MEISLQNRFHVRNVHSSFSRFAILKHYKYCTMVCSCVHQRTVNFLPNTRILYTAIEYPHSHAYRARACIAQVGFCFIDMVALRTPGNLNLSLEKIRGTTFPFGVYHWHPQASDAEFIEPAQLRCAARVYAAHCDGAVQVAIGTSRGASIGIPGPF